MSVAFEGGFLSVPHDFKLPVEKTYNWL
jgi:hypothetical protein